MDMLWNGWGDPAEAMSLPDPVLGLLRDLLGAPLSTVPSVELSAVTVPPSRLPAQAAAALQAVVATENVCTDAQSRIRHTRGKSTTDLLRMRMGEATGAPDAVVLPGDHAEVLAVLAVCAEYLITVVPFGGGTSVVGGLTAPAARTVPAQIRDRPRIALDLRRLNRLIAVDPVSRTATFEAGMRAPQAEALLRERGFTLGHFPQSFEWATVGGFAATRSSGQSSAGYGRFDDMVVGLTVATPQGDLDLGRAPKSAAGPDLRQLILGSEGVFGVITSVTVAIRPAPETTVHEGWRFPSFEVGTAAVRTLAQDGPLPTVLRLSDEAETMAGLARADEAGMAPSPAGSLMIAGFAGTAADVADRRAGAGTVLRRAGGEPLGPEPGDSWARGRFTAPYLRDALLASGLFAETLETAAFWERIPGLYAAVRDTLATALRRTPPLLMCHISHVYCTGASLYFTVVFAQGADAVADWARVKSAVNDVIIDAGGTISHHHGVGIDHLDGYAREMGRLGADVLRAIKGRLDPAGILNPGVLLPGAEHTAGPGRR